MRMGIDVGSQYTKAALLTGTNGHPEVFCGLSLTGFDMRSAVEAAIAEALESAGANRQDVRACGITGQGAEAVKQYGNYGQHVNEIAATAAGAHFIAPSCRTILEAGAEEARAVRCDERGVPVNFVLSDKCAAGAGTFVETMAKALKVSTEQFISLSLQSTAEIPLNAQCAIFAESEVISLIHSETPTGDIARAVHDAIAERTGALIRSAGLVHDILVVGGLSLNKAYVASLARQLGVNITSPARAQHVNAIGAALNATL